jgi:serine/threonine-protein kinase
MSPEQAAGRVEVDPRSDIYALGVILYEALSGRLPFLEENYNALMIDIAVNEPPALATVTTGLPKALLELVGAAMTHERDARIQSAGDLARRIEALLATLGAASTHPVPDPACLGSGAPPGKGHASPLAQTSSALSSSAQSRARRSSSVVGVLLVAAIAGLALGAWALLGRGFDGRTSHASGATTLAESPTADPVSSPAVPFPRPTVATTPVAPPSAASAAISPSAGGPAVPSVPPPSSAPASSAGPVPPTRPSSQKPGQGQGRSKGVWSYD